MDPKANPTLSAYSCFANNPIIYVDPHGDTTYYFRPDGTFWYVGNFNEKGVKGVVYTRTVTKTIKHPYGEAKLNEFVDPVEFSFNDFNLDKHAIEAGLMDVEIITEEDIELAMNYSGVTHPDNKKNPTTYIERESRPEGDEAIFSGKSTGKMDYVISSPIVKRSSLHVVLPASGTKQKAVGYNAFDFGNFLWGQGARRLGFPLHTASHAAHVNNAVNGRSDNPGVETGILDSDADQRAIIRGWSYNNKEEPADAVF